jgi:hypothetical protein
MSSNLRRTMLRFTRQKEMAASNFSTRGGGVERKAPCRRPPTSLRALAPFHLIVNRAIDRPSVPSSLLSGSPRRPCISVGRLVQFGTTGLTSRSLSSSHFSAAGSCSTNGARRRVTAACPRSFAPWDQQAGDRGIGTRISPRSPAAAIGVRAPQASAIPYCS